DAARRSSRCAAEPGHEFRIANCLPCSSLRAKRSNPALAPQGRKLDCFVASLLAMTWDIASRSRRVFFARGLLFGPAPSEKRARGIQGARCARSLACKIDKTRKHSHHEYTGITRHSPRNGLRLIRTLPGDRACLTPSPAKVAFRELDANR